MTQPGTNWDQLGRYMAGELSPVEAGDVQRWLAANAQDDKALAALAKATSSLDASRSVDVDAALRKVKARIAATEQPASWRRYAGWAAAAAVILVAGAVWGRSGFTDVSRAVPTAYSTGVGARDSMVLADGSRVILGPASRVIVKGRDVELTSGEAYFVVTHDAERPFTVRVNGAVIRDIGTEFSVHSDQDSDVRVVVREGSVQLARNASAVVLAKGDVGMMHGGQVTASRGAATADDLAWTSGKLVFRDAPVAELAADLRRWYGVELKVTDSALLKRHFTGAFTSDPAARVVDAIALALGARADHRGDTVFIRPVTTTR